MRFSQVLPVCFAVCASACVRDFGLRNSALTKHGRIAKRAVEFPPVLSEAESILVNSFDNNSISDWSYYYTHGDHLGGHNRSMAEWTAARWAENGLSASLAEYNVHVTYPRESSLSLTYPNGSVYNANLIEEVLAEDDTTSYPNRIPAYHAMSGSGDVTAEYVYVGRGTQADFAKLIESGIELEGKIALAKYGGGYRGLKVKNAQDNGMIGCVIFTDPGDDGNITEANGYAPYPDGPARNPSSIQRGSVRFSSVYSGDPTTVGYASTQDAPRGDTKQYTPSIPSVPISMVDAVPMLAALDGFGISAQEANRSGWIGGLNVSYSSGPAPGVNLNLVNIMDEYLTPVWDTIGIINGTREDEVIVIGNHRDAWVIGGAADPNSGSAVLIEMSRALGRLMATGWKPKRTIILGSWDAEEFGLQGSTEWVEDHLPWLTTTAVAYLNLDIAVSGPRTALAGTGEMHTIALDMMKKVLFPEEYDLGPTLYDAWYDRNEGEIPPLGSGSDYAAFSQNGIGALDIGSDGGPNDPVYHYHSNYDTYHWMATFGDPGFKLHTTMGQFIALLTYHLADDTVIPFDMPNAATVLRAYFAELEESIEAADVELDTAELEAALDTFAERAAAIDAVAQNALAMNDSVMLDVVNEKYKAFQRGFVSQGGLPRRPTFKNLLMAPGLDSGYSAVVFPPITEGAEQGDLELAAEWVSKSARAILRAAEILDV